MRERRKNMTYKAIKTKLYLNHNEKKLLLYLMHEAKNLYNQALYNVRQHYFETNQYLTYVDNYKLLKDSMHYRTLSTSLAQSVIRKVDEAMKAFFGSIKSKKTKKVKLPRYLDKDGFYPLIDRMVYKAKMNEYTLPRGNFIKRLSKQFEEISCKLIKKNLSLSEIESLSLKIDTPKCITNKQIKEITIKEKYDGQYIEVIYVYEEDEQIKNKTNKTETMGIDFGYNNLAMCALTNGKHLLIDGLKLKSMNQRYWKKISRLASLRENQKILTRRMIRLIEKRNNQMTYGMNKAAKLIIEHAKQEKVKEIIIGYNEGFKDIKSNKQNHQWFKAIPIARLRDRIILLAEENHIGYKVIDEAYTSMASFIDKDEFKQREFSGKRIKRGLYQSKKGILINADLNASLNMIRKSKPGAFGTGFKGWNTPKRTYLFG
jgi:IS605 OrfB family transposase